MNVSGEGVSGESGESEGLVLDGRWGYYYDAVMEWQRGGRGREILCLPPAPSTVGTVHRPRQQ